MTDLLKESRFRLDIQQEINPCEDSETLGQVTHRSCGCPIPEVSKVRLDEQPGLVKGVPAPSRELQLDDL